MELNLQNLKFSNGYILFTYFILVFSPCLIYIMIYDFTMIEKLDNVKIILISVALGGFLFIFDVFLCSLYVYIMESLGANKNEKKDDENVLDTEGSFGMVIYVISSLFTVGEIVYLKFYTKEPYTFWLKDSINTWLLSQLILFSILILVGIFFYKKNNSVWKIRRSKKSIII
jgi:hypothetical protein